MLSNHTWVTLPNGPWKVQDAQAAVNVAISLLTIVTAFVSIRLYWQRAASKIVAGDHVAVHSLLSISSIGDVLDTVFLLKGRLLSREYMLLFTQCLLVLSFAASSIFGGIIARYSVRRWTVIELQPVSGYLANHEFTDINFANVQWNTTIQTLNASSFPMNQLVDFMPNDGIPWVYQANQWNNSWSMDCKQTEKTPLKFVSTGNCTDFFSEVPAIAQAFPTTTIENWYPEGWGYGPSDTYDNFQFFWYGDNQTSLDSDDNVLAMNIIISAIQIHNMVKPDPDTNSTCNFGVGTADAASYTRITCSLTRTPDVEDPWNIAFPDTDTGNMISAAYAQYFQARFEAEGVSNLPISPISPYELTRFYQAYHASKDIRSREPVSRTLDVQVSVVQISIIFLVIASLVVLFVVFASLKIVLNWYFRRNAVVVVPQSKLEWMLQSIYQSQTIAGYQHRTHEVVSPVDEKVAFDAAPELGRTHSCARKRDPRERQSVFGEAKFGGAGIRFGGSEDTSIVHGEPKIVEQGGGMTNFKDIPAWNISRV